MFRGGDVPGLESAGNCMDTSVCTAMHVHGVCMRRCDCVCLGSENESSVSRCVPVTLFLIHTQSAFLQPSRARSWQMNSGFGDGKTNETQTDGVSSLSQTKMIAESEASQIVASPTLFGAGLPRGSCRSTCNVRFWHEYCVNYWTIHISADAGSEACSLPAT